MSLLTLRPSEPDDLDFIIAAEQHPDNRSWIIPYSRDQHLQVMRNNDILHAVLEQKTDGDVGFIMLAGLNDPNDSLEFRRIVITEKRKGYGRAALKQVQQLAFEEKNVHRLWLDVKVENRRARSLYKSEGFTEDGLLRESLKTGNGYESLVIMSMLRHEYFETNDHKPNQL
ncbi:MAG: GNAT family N-acetyltransferase [Balneolaceae bacterium]